MPDRYRFWQRSGIRPALDPERCNGCGLCVAVCKDNELILAQGRVAFSGHPLFGCIGCGHCMAICPTGAIRILGRTLSPDDLFDLPKRESATPYAPLQALLQRRRSIREFQARPVESELIDKILAATQTWGFHPPMCTRWSWMDRRATTGSPGTGTG